MPDSPQLIAPPRLTTRECEELNVWSDVVGFETDYQQVERGRFDAWFDMIVAEDLRIVDQYCNREMAISGVPPEGFIPLLITRNRNAKGIFQGKALEENEVSIMRPGFEGTYRTPQDLRLTTLLFPEDRLRRAVASIDGGDFDALIPGTRLFKLPGQTVDRLCSITDKILSAARAGPGSFSSRMWLPEIQDLFVTTLVGGLSAESDVELKGLARRNRVRAVSAARDYIEANLGDPLGTEVISQAIGVSPRTLEYAFRDIFDTTPLLYLKNRRLHAARRRLLEDSEPKPTVTSAAQACGFHHLSYFARDYRAMFGESPSETLALP